MCNLSTFLVRETAVSTIPTYLCPEIGNTHRWLYCGRSYCWPLVVLLEPAGRPTLSLVEAIFKQTFRLRPGRGRRDHRSPPGLARGWGPSSSCRGAGHRNLGAAARTWTQGGAGELSKRAAARGSQRAFGHGGIIGGNIEKKHKQ